MKASYRYFLPPLINLTILIVFVFLWTDRLELIFDPTVRLIESLKILGITFLIFAVTQLMLKYFLKNISRSIGFKIRIISFMTILISSWIYFTYSQKIAHNIFLNKELRKQVAEKITPINEFNNGSEANNLTIKEYQEISETNNFPKIPKEARDIHYSLYYDGFLPDYSLTLQYDLPIDIIIDTMNFKNGDFSKSQTFEIHDKIKRVSYHEVLR